jgi:hypothetical protein
MFTAEFYRERAREWLRLASISENESVRLQFLIWAEEFREKAEDLEPAKAAGCDPGAMPR